MKQTHVTSLFFTTFLIVLFCTSQRILCQTKNHRGKLDSIENYYFTSNDTCLSIPTRLENLNRFLNGAYYYREDSLIYKGLRQKTWLLNKNKMYDSAIYYTNKLYDLAKDNKDTIYIEKAFTKLGIYYKNNDQLNQSFKYHNEAFKISRKIEDSVSAGKSLLFMANIQKSLGDFTGSKTTAIDALKYLENSSELKKIVGLYLNISIAYREQKDYAKALEYNSKSLYLRKDSLLINKIGRKNFLKLKTARANILSDQKRYKESIFILSELLSDSSVLKSKKEHARILSNLGYIKWLKNKENTISDSLLLKALRIRKKINDSQGLIASNIHLAKYYFDTDKKKALKYAEVAYNYAHKRNSLPSILEALGLVFDLKEETNTEAQIYHEVNQKLNRINQNNREVYAVTKYENDKLTEDNTKKSQQVLEERNQKTIYLFGVITLIILVVLIIYFFRQRFKHSEQENKIKLIETAYETETQISKTIHDEVSNNVFQVMLQFQNNPNDPLIPKKLNDIYNKTRDISRENSGFDIEEEYQEQLETMLNSYASDSTTLFLKGQDQINWQKINKAIKITLYPVLQELMTNMKKHSQASQVAITFTKNVDKLMITYFDNGIGISKKDIENKNGLRNTEKRIQAINGTIIFDSEKEKGFKAKIQILN